MYDLITVCTILLDSNILMYICHMCHMTNTIVTYSVK